MTRRAIAERVRPPKITSQARNEAEMAGGWCWLAHMEMILLEA
jgi:hypothetical protein